MKMPCLPHKCFILHLYKCTYWIKVYFLKIKKIIDVDDVTFYPSSVSLETVWYVEVSIVLELLTLWGLQDSIMLLTTRL